LDDLISILDFAAGARFDPNAFARGLRRLLGDAQLRWGAVQFHAMRHRWLALPALSLLVRRITSRSAAIGASRDASRAARKRNGKIGKYAPVSVISQSKDEPPAQNGRPTAAIDPKEKCVSTTEKSALFGARRGVGSSGPIDSLRQRVRLVCNSRTAEISD
jgi:hypothetical protein